MLWNISHLIAAASKRAAFHGARVVVAGMVELHMTCRGVQSIENGRQSATQGEQSVPGVTESHAHAALVSQWTAVPQQASEHK